MKNDAAEVAPLPGSGTALKLVPLSPAIGAEVRGLDLARLDEGSFAAIGSAWLEHVVRSCQTNENWSPKPPEPGFSGRQLKPLGQGGGAVLLEDFAAVEMAVLVEVIVERGVNGGEFLKRLDISELGHRPFSTSERLMRVLGAIVEPATALQTRSITDHRHCGSV
jgi:hypothetical protein